MKIERCEAFNWLVDDGGAPIIIDRRPIADPSISFACLELVIEVGTRRERYSAQYLSKARATERDKLLQRCT